MTTHVYDITEDTDVLLEKQREILDTLTETRRDRYKSMQNERRDKGQGTGFEARYFTYIADNYIKEVKGYLLKILDPKPVLHPKGYKDIRRVLIEVLSVMDLDEFSALLCWVTFRSVLSSIGFAAQRNKNATYNSVVHAITSAIQSETSLHIYIEEADTLYRVRVNRSLEHRTKVTSKIGVYKAYKNKPLFDEWSEKAFERLAIFTYAALFEVSGYFEEISNWSTKKAKNTTSIVIMSPSFMKAWSESVDSSAALRFSYCPAILQPEDWTDIYNDVYFTGRPFPLIRARYIAGRPSLSFEKEYIEKLEKADLSKVYGALNALQQVPWHINKRMFSLVTEIKNIGTAIAGLPEDADHYDKKHPGKRASRRKIGDWLRAGIDRSTAYLRMQITIGQAGELVKYDRIYMPYNLDYRGRIYTIPVHLSPQGNDLSRALLALGPIKAETEKAGRKAYDAAVIMLANHAGFDKRPVEERRRWVVENKAYIRKAARSPLDSLDFWQFLDEPLQAMAMMLELSEFWDMQDRIGISAYTDFGWTRPIYRDGTCNALQHYAMLTHDRKLAGSVNLIKGDGNVNDIYGIILNQVIQRMKIDAVKGTGNKNSIDKRGTRYMKYGTQSLAQMWLERGIERSVIKSIVMPVCYGGTAYGALESLSDYAFEKKFSVPHQYGSYLKDLIYETMEEYIAPAQSVMSWIKTAARCATLSGPLSWTAPSGLPIMCDAVEVHSETINSLLFGKHRRFYSSSKTPNVDKAKQNMTAPPNLIHSFDAAHCVFAALEAEKAGIKNLATVHDCFVSDPVNIDRLTGIVKYTMFEMYADGDLLQKYSAETGGSDPTELITGDYDPKEILGSVYAFN